MCGITGFAERNHKAETARRIVKGMADLITYRGPDGEGYYVDDQVALGHRRLSIIDLEGGKQPMFNEDQNLAVIFNGEIYNFQELTAELMRAGHTFATRSDTEVLLHGYEQWGKEMLQKLRGMFTFAIWDRKNETLFCARDHFGIKPFYYYQTEDGELLYGTMIRDIIGQPGFKKELNEEMLQIYMSLTYGAGEDTFFKGLKKLLPGRYLIWKDGKVEIHRYWTPKFQPDESKSLEDWADEIHSTLKSIMPEVKTEDEIAKLARAEQIGDEAFTEIVKFIHENWKDGLTEQRVALQLEYEMRLRGAEGTSFDTIAASGSNSSLPHAMPQPKLLTEGDFLTMDFGCMYQGYCSDMTRTIHIGEVVESEQKKVYDTVLQAQLAALSVVKPGMVCSDVDKCARDIIADAGYGDYFGHGLGHSVGLFIHEEPRFSMKCDAVLKPGVVITVEPGIYLPGRFGVRIEDMIVVTEDGYQNLASSPKELICV